MRNLKGTSTWINEKRLRDYPRLMLIATWLIIVLNILFRDGWQGGLGQIIGGDFIMFYSTGRLYNEDPSKIYNYDQQAQIQQALASPTILPGLNPYMNPPYVAPIYSLLTALPLPWAFLTWTVSMIILAFISVRVLIMIVPDETKIKGLNYTQLLILVLSFFPFIESLQAGQNSGLTLLLMTGLIYFTSKEKHFLSGVVAGLMIYKPQYILGFLILWVVWKNIKSLAGFALVALAWIGSFYLANGSELFRDYQNLSQVFILLPYFEGFPAYILVTLYGLLSTLLPQSAQPFTYGLTQAVLVGSVTALALYAFNTRHKPIIDRIPAIVLAILLPLLATPYALLHDLVILIPGFVLWTRYDPRRELLLAAITIYFGAFFLTLLSALNHIALNALLVIGLVALIIYYLARRPLHSSASTA
jgi:hypothetical protein